ncbi:glycosyltransferase family 4 protein [Evansella cellulosilytica]|uniref:Glycosyl transferase group 1 n=1 Tax=Evansella cellulosilytica (strain ATCC 21833 / DSM 2522 / FERM P-1141 / JCM 9156 / N-4) TaxID=649639 RepID=E6U1R9_EVAC2|nr:glycosyltransferase family 1 protein [Evansella cellulosilytica]ADU31566.1 glycosyl transferase group 1 [Evansella cellulosilytica DSM 2522]
MRIALFSDTFTPQVNGVSKTMNRLVHYLGKEKIDYDIFVPELNDDESLFNGNVHRFASLPFILYPECRIALPNVLTIRQRLHALQPELIHIATPFNMGLCGLHYSNKYHVPFVASYHTHFDHYLHYYKLGFMLPWIWKYQQWFHRDAKRVFVPSKETMSHLEKKGFQHLSLWQRGVDCDLFHPNYDPKYFRQKYSINKKYILLYVGRLAPEKDLHILSEVISNMPSHQKELIQWVFVGEGPMKDELKEKHRDDVIFTGYLDGEELASAYSSADLFVFPSTSETFGNVVLESLASGTPAIVSNSGGVKEIVTNGETGMICPGKKADAFLKSITTILFTQDLNKKMSLKARAYAKTQSWNHIFSNLVSEYEQVIYENEQRSNRIAQ